MRLDAPLKPTAPVFTRIIAAAVDLTIVFLLSLLASFFIYRGAMSTNKTLIDSYENQYLHLYSTHLAKEIDDSLYSYPASEYYEKNEEGEYNIIAALSYFYLNYMTNSDIPEGEEGSLSFNDEIIVNGTTYIQKDYFTISWFNETILGLPKEGETSEIDYFMYQKDGDNDDYTKIGTVNSKYISKIELDGEITYKVEMSKEMEAYTTNEYTKAVTTFQNQKFYKKWTKEIDNASALITLLCRLFFVLIVYILLPMLLKGGKTLGKLMFKLSLARFDDSDIKKWQVIPRAAFFIIVPVIMFFIPNTLINIAIMAGLIITSICVMAASKRKTALHDIIARTIVIDDYYKKKLIEEKEQAELLNEEPLIEDDVTFEEEPKED